MRQLVLLIHNIRSTHNVGSLLRTADGLGISKVYISGYTPFPALKKDNRLPHIVMKLDKQIHKTALGAEKSVEWEVAEDINKLINRLSKNGFEIVALEQTSTATALSDFKPTRKIALLIGSEVTGIEPKLLAQINKHVYIPMFGKKESFNVVQATAMALYHFRFTAV